MQTLMRVAFDCDELTAAIVQLLEDRYAEGLPEEIPPVFVEGLRRRRFGQERVGDPERRALARLNGAREAQQISCRTGQDCTVCRGRGQVVHECNSWKPNH